VRNPVAYLINFIIATLLLVNTAVGQGRVVINEFMPWSGCNTTSEYIELLNFGPGPMNIGCYIVTNGQYAVTIPANTILQPGEYYVLAGQNVLAVDCGNVDSAVTVDLNWTTCNCTDKPVPTTGDGFMQNGGSSNEKVVLLSPTLSVLDAASRSLPASSSLSITTSTNGATCTASTFDLDLMTVNYEAISSSTGIDNSFARRVDGDCGWVKTTDISAGAPNKTGSTSSASYSFSTLSASECNGSTGSISIAVSAVDVGALFPMTYTLAYDADSNSIFNASDTYIFGVDSSAPSININNLAYGRYRITVGSSSGCNLQSYDFFIFNCYGVVLPFRLLSITHDGLKDNKRSFLVHVTGIANIQKAVLEAKNDTGFVQVGSLTFNDTVKQEEYIRLYSSLMNAEVYRVLLISKTNVRYYSHELIIRSAADNRIRLWPNPATNIIRLHLPGRNRYYSYSIVNSTGGRVAKGNVFFSQSTSELPSISISDLKKGVYTLLMSGDLPGEHYQASFIKQ
jgi:hypothetical protein